MAMVGQVSADLAGAQGTDRRSRLAGAREQLKGLNPLGTGSGSLFPVFSFFWIVAVLAHGSHMRHFGNVILTEVTPDIRLPLGLVVNVVALWALLKPGSLGRFFTLVAVQLFDFAVHSPAPTNHWVFVTVVNVAIVIAALGLARDSSAPLTGERLFQTFAPALRASVIVLYLFAAVAKMNWSYLDPAWSCAISQPKAAGFLPDVPFLHVLAIYGSIAVECAIPVLFLFRRMRPFAILLGSCFHFGIGIFRHHDFLATMMAAYVAFIDPDIPRRIWSNLGLVRRAQSLLLRVSQLAAHRATFPVLAAVMVAVALAGSYDGRLRDPAAMTSALACVVTAAIAIVAYAFALRTPRVAESGQVEENLPRRAPLFASVALLIVVGMSPYLGLRTDSSFTMFSNLQTEGDQWNHIFLPSTLRVFDFQTDLVRIVESSHPQFHAMALGGDRLVFNSFRRRMKGHIERYRASGDEFSIHYEYRGQAHRIEKATVAPALWEPEGWLESRLLKFRVVAPSDRSRCMH